MLNLGKEYGGGPLGCDARTIKRPQPQVLGHFPPHHLLSWDPERFSFFAPTPFRPPEKEPGALAHGPWRALARLRPTFYLVPRWPQRVVEGPSGCLIVA
eukprot:scaffold32977_cov27-Tisochrysis_lutea.AAC.1